MWAYYVPAIPLSPLVAVDYLVLMAMSLLSFIAIFRLQKQCQGQVGSLLKKKTKNFLVSMIRIIHPYSLNTYSFLTCLSNCVVLGVFCFIHFNAWEGYK